MLSIEVLPCQKKLKKACYSYIGDYLFNDLDLLGEGFSSRVYKGINSNNKSKILVISEQVAVKVIDTDILGQPIHVTLLESELEVLEKMKGCDHILQMHSIIRQGKDTFIVTQVCDTDLARVINPLLPIQTVQKYLQQILRGFKQIFSKEIIHRDLKPANLLIDSNGNIKIADFGFAIKSSQARKQTKFNIGSPLYMAPEALKKNQYSSKSDVWAIGVILYEMLTGDTPWKAENEDELYEKLEKIKIEEILANDNFPEHLNIFLTKTLQFDRKSRISPQDLFLLDVGANTKIINQNQQLIVKDQIKSQNLLMIPKVIKATKTQKFSRPAANKLNDLHKTHKKGSTDMKQDSVSINIRPARRNTQIKQFQHSTLDSIPVDGKQTTSNSSARTIGSNTVAIQEVEALQVPKMTKQQLKSITNRLIYYIHVCRLLYKDIVRIDECIENKLNQNVVSSLSEVRDSIVKLYCNIVVKYIHKVKNVANNNFIDLPQRKLNEYIASNEYKKVRKVSSEYIQKYSKSNQLKYLWVQRQEPDLSAARKQTTSIISFLWSELCQKNHGQIILLEFLLFTRQALQALEEGQLESLPNKERIQDYVDTIPNPPSFGRFKRAIAQAKKISSQAKRAQKGEPTS